MKEKTISIAPDFTFAKQNNISLPLVFIDGISRCGKSALSEVVPSLTNMEHIQFAEELEWIISGLSLSGLRKDYAAALLQIYFNQKSYNLHISRNVNFRPTDQTSVLNYKNPELYCKRLEIPDGIEILEHCLGSENYLPLQTHDLLVNIELIQELELDFRMLSLWRNPVENIYSWWSRGWGERFYNNDASNFSLMINDENQNTYPWYAAKNYQQLIGLNAAERCVVVALDLIERCIVSFKNNAQKEKVLLLFFEDLCTTTDLEMNKICGFLNVDKTELTQSALDHARLPRELSKVTVDDKIASFREVVNPSLFKHLMSFQTEYYTNRYGLL